jgi:SAM-dependent methyltransferase
VASRGYRYAAPNLYDNDEPKPLVTDPYDWKGRVGQNWARDYTRTDRSFAGLTTVLVDRVRAMSPGCLLDIGCGAGETSIAIGRACAKADILGIDLSEPLVAAARRRGRALTNVRFAVADAASWHDPVFVPDTLISRHGVMFFDDPVNAFTNLGRASKPGAHLIFSCFRDRSENAWATEIGMLVGGGAPSDPTAPGPFAFADKAHVTRILAAAGWEKITFDAVDWDYVAGDGSDPVADAVAYFQRIGPAASAIAGLEGAERARLLTDIASLAEKHRRGGRVAFNASAWIVTARVG